MRNILIIKKEAGTELLKLHLEAEGYHVSVVSGVSDVSEIPDVSDFVFIEAAPGDTEAFSLVRELRKISEVPVFLLLDGGEAMDRVLGMSLGADECISTPVELMEQVAKVNSLIRRCYQLQPEREKSSVFRYGELSFDTVSMRLYKDKSPVPLTPKELKLILNLMREPGKLFSKEELCNLIFDDAIRCDVNSLMVHISHLRDKIEKDPRKPVYIFNVRGRGYRFGRKGTEI